MKQRIIGALVLISLAVIFVPMMFDEPHDNRDVRSLDIPEEPPFPEVEVPEADESLSGVPDYRVEELEPSNEPELVEDPAMGIQPGDEGPALSPSPTDGAVAGVEEAAGPASPSEQGVGAEARVAEEAPANGGQASNNEAEPTSAPDAPVSEDSQPSLEGAWVLQLGSFGNEENARRLRDSVRDRGYGAQLQEVVRGDQRLLRVLSGPFAEKAEAEKAKQVLDKAFGVKSLVTQGEG